MDCEEQQDYFFQYFESWGDEWDSMIWGLQRVKFANLRDQIILAFFQMYWMLADWIGRLKSLARFCRPSGPKWFRRSNVRPFGHAAEELLKPLMAFPTWFVVEKKNRCYGPEDSHARAAVLRCVPLGRMYVELRLWITRRKHWLFYFVQRFQAQWRI